MPKPRSIAENAIALAPWHTGTIGLFAGALMRAGNATARKNYRRTFSRENLTPHRWPARPFPDVRGNRAGGELGLEGARAARSSFDFQYRAIAIAVAQLASIPLQV
jgi:hypothetical protein